MTFQVWKMKFLTFMTFQVFHDLCEPCYTFTNHFAVSSHRKVVFVLSCSD